MTSLDLSRGDLCLWCVPTGLHRDVTTNRSIGCEAARLRFEEQAFKARHARAQHRVRALHVVHRSGNRHREVGV